MVKDEIRKYQLDNGVRIVTEKIPGVRSVAIGIWVGAGSRHENDKISGISHFIEHLMFKGTEKRSAADIAEKLDSVGGQLNAFTTKEFTCYYAKVIDEHFDLALDVLSDMFFNSSFKDTAIEKERGVIEEEIRMYEDTPDELIHDLFVQTVWPKHTLGRPILGTIESLEKITRNDILKYIQEQYTTDRLVIALAGNIDHQLVYEKVANYFNQMKTTSVQREILPPEIVEQNINNVKKDTGQIQICLGTKGISQIDKRLYMVHILNNILGGGLSSRLVQSIREQRGLAYSVYTYHSAFSDTGLFTFYAGTSPSKYDEVVDVLMQEIGKIVKDGITEKELNKTKDQIKGSMLLGLESVSSRMSRNGRNELCLNRIVSVEELIKRVSAVTLDDVNNIAKTLFQEQPFSLSTIGPLEEPIDLKRYKDKYLG